MASKTEKYNKQRIRTEANKIAKKKKREEYIAKGKARKEQRIKDGTFITLKMRRARKNDNKTV